jgi:uncharacterized membrane protein YfcA
VDRLRQNSLTDDEKAVIVTSIQIMVVSVLSSWIRHCLRGNGVWDILKIS